MRNTKEMLSNLRNFLFSKPRKGTISDILKDIVKCDLHISEGSQEYDEYEQLIEDKLDSIKKKLEKEDVPDAKITFITDEYVEIEVFGELSIIKKEISTLTGDRFEDLCEEIFKKHISDNIQKTVKHSFEDKHCVDIMGDISVIEGIPVKTKLYMQIKNKSGEIILNDLKEFIGGVKLVMSTKGQEHGYMHSYILLYVTSSDFHQDAIDYMNKIGVIYINGYQLAELIKKHKIDYKIFTAKVS